VLWGVVLSGPVTFMAGVLTTSRHSIVTEAADPVTINEAHQHGATSILAWVAHDDLGAAVMLFTYLTFVIMLIVAGTLADREAWFRQEAS
jgi:hypothetical protein